MQKLIKIKRRLLPILLIITTVISLISCKTEPPKEPLTHDCTVIVHNDSSGEPDWNAAYIFCALKQDPNNPKYHERWPLFPFLLGSLEDEQGIKPRLIKGKDYQLREKWETEIKQWALENCMPKKE